MEIVVNENNIRIDKYLSLNTDYSRSSISKLINDGLIKVNNKVIKDSYKIKNNDVILIEEDKIIKPSFTKENIPLDILYEDDYLMVINKPSGLVVHPGSGVENHTLVNALMYHTDNLSDIEGPYRKGIVHRLDKDTSGLMIVAKTNETHELLNGYFSTHNIKREYIALINGIFPNKKAKIDIPIKRSNKDFRKMEANFDGKKAITNLEVIKYYDKYTLVKLNLETGRTHQIRAQLAYLGYPVFNDPIYSKDKCTSFGQFLHSHSLTFIHPITKKELHFEIPLPIEFQNFLDNLY